MTSNRNKQIARERIDILFKQAKKTFKQSPILANKYIKGARKLSMKYKVKIPPEYKKLFCKNCYQFLRPAITMRTRIKNKRLVYYCTSCHHITRYPLKKSKTIS